MSPAFHVKINSLPRPGIKRLWDTVALLITLVCLLGCDKNSRPNSAVAEPIFSAVRAQIKALNRRDATAALAIMHPAAPGLDRTRQTTEQVTATYDLLYMLQNLTLDSADANEAQVRFTQITRKVSGPEFRNNRVTGIHTLRKYQGAWKIYYTQVLTIDYLDK
jgi:hypothetical protein